MDEQQRTPLRRPVLLHPSVDPPHLRDEFEEECAAAPFGRLHAMAGAVFLEKVVQNFARAKARKNQP